MAMVDLNGEIMYQTLLIAVAVLGTLVGMGLIVAIGWFCIRWLKKRSIVHGQCCWHHETQSYDAYSFPPPHRERVQMRCLRGCNKFMRHCCQMSLSNNNTGVSRGLGLGASCVNDPVPAPPAPRSWTPSPPYNCQQDNIQLRKGNQSRVGEFSCHLGSQRVSTPDSTSNKCSVHENQLHFNKKDNSYCRPHSSLPLSSKYQPATNSKGDFTDIKIDINSGDSENSSGVVALSHKKKKAYFYRKNKNSSHSSHHQSARQKRNVERRDICVSKQPSVFSDKLEQCKKGSTCNDHPAACSSYCILPSKVPQSFATQKPVGIMHNYSDRDSPNCPNSFDQCLQENGIEIGQFHRNIVNHEPSRRLKSVLPQIKENSSSPVSFISATRSPWTHVDNQVDDQTNTTYLCPTRSVTSHVLNPPISRTDELIRRDFADKYGFCQSCGHLPDSHKMSRGVKMITRSTQTYWGHIHSIAQVDETQETTVDPMPSLSWDHLTPMPSPAYLQTVVVGTTRNDDLITQEGEREYGIGNTTDERAVHQDRRDLVYSSHHENDERGAVGGW